MKSLVAATVTLCILASAPRAQTHVEVSRCCALYGPGITEAVYAFDGDQTASATVERILEDTGFPQGFRVLAGNVKGVVAAIEGGERFILYDTYLVENAERDERLRREVVMLFGHAIGHHVNNDSLAPWPWPPGQTLPLEQAAEELKADRFAGAALARLGFEQKVIQVVYDGRSGTVIEGVALMHRVDASNNGWISEGSHTGHGFDADDIPQFPWPPPKASASVKVPVEVPSAAGATLYDAAVAIESGLDACGYNERSYYAVPGGFALASRMEQINDDGTPIAIPGRWSIKVRPFTKFSITNYVRALFTAPKGRFRVIVFVVTATPFSQANVEVSTPEARAWLTEGLDVLPESIGGLPYSQRHRCTALIYEFEKHAEDETDVSMMDPSELSGRDHIEAAKLWTALTK